MSTCAPFAAESPQAEQCSQQSPQAGPRTAPVPPSNNQNAAPLPDCRYQARRGDMQPGRKSECQRRHIDKAGFARTYRQTRTHGHAIRVLSGGATDFQRLASCVEFDPRAPVHWAELPACTTPELVAGFVSCVCAAKHPLIGTVKYLLERKYGRYQNAMGRHTR